MQAQEVLVRLQVGVGLGQREQLAQRAGQHVLGLRLLLGTGLLRLHGARCGPAVTASSVPLSWAA